jgi:hypothetical protein
VFRADQKSGYLHLHWFLSPHLSLNRPITLAARLGPYCLGPLQHCNCWSQSQLARGVPSNRSWVSAVLCSYRHANGVILRSKSPTKYLEYSVTSEVNSALERTTQLLPQMSKKNHENRRKKWLKESEGNTIQELDPTAVEEWRILSLLAEIQTQGLLNMRHVWRTRGPWLVTAWNIDISKPYSNVTFFNSYKHLSFNKPKQQTEPRRRSRYRTSCGLHSPGFESRQGQETLQNRPYRFWSPPSLIFNGYGVLFPW